MANPRKDLLVPGGKFGDYTVVKLLGSGGMGTVYLVRGDASGTEVAVKILDPEVEKSDPEYKQRFIFEAELATKIRHPNLIGVYDVGRDPETGFGYIMMEYVPGGTVRDRISKWGALSIEESTDIVYRVAQALVAVDQHRVVHRDIKPDNIMFTADGVTPKLADLGIARLASGKGQNTTLTQSGYLIGSPAYMSPEQMEDSHGADIRSDIHALGITFWEMLAGRRPYEGEDTMAIVARAMKGTPVPDVRHYRPDVPPRLAVLIARMCHPDVAQRFQTPQQVVDELRRFRSGTPDAARVSAAARRAKVSRTRNRALFIGIGSIVAGMLVASCAVVALVRSVRPAPEPVPVPPDPLTVLSAEAPVEEAPVAETDSAVAPVVEEAAPAAVEPTTSTNRPPVKAKPKAVPGKPAVKPAPKTAVQPTPAKSAARPASAFIEAVAPELRIYATYRQQWKAGKRSEADAAILMAVNEARLIDPDMRLYDFDGRSEVPGRKPLTAEQKRVYRLGKLILMLELLRADHPKLMESYAREKVKACAVFKAVYPLSIHDTVFILGRAAGTDLFPFFQEFGVKADPQKVKPSLRR